ncbi:MAG: hypothetical protein KatS3mg129_1872 [Leptospiraceae bacterium]|nr:MAG: hypothetical protein KatS3mg129_1872 [Leptospiraceae bacterium]
MGKSLQGLVGTIVLSSILSAILKRTEKRNIEKERFPETWLKYTSLEIHEVLETFQGFMMVSAIIGLLDIENGLLYFINFDHPKPIYIHKNHYRLIYSKIHKKLGFPKYNEIFEVTRIPLSREDIFIIGSDGKDEILINNTINEDENFSLQLLQKSEANIDIFINTLKNHYIIKDDISIIKIQYKSRPSFPLIVTEDEKSYNDYSSYIKNIKQILQELLQKKEYQTIIDLFKNLVEVYPVDDEILYWYSYSCRKIKRYLEAVEIGERLLNFNKNYIKNYFQLIYCYKKINHQYRINLLLEQLKEITKQSKYIHKIKILLTINKKKLEKYIKVIYSVNL